MPFAIGAIATGTLADAVLLNSNPLQDSENLGDIHAVITSGKLLRREDLGRREVELEGAHAGERAGGCADLGGEIRKRRDVVARERRLGGELHAGDLHAVARVAAEADDDIVAGLDALRTAGCAVRHLSEPPRL